VGVHGEDRPAGRGANRFVAHPLACRPIHELERRENCVKILVPIKRVADPDNANKIKVSPNGQIDASGLEPKMNPFDEYALEAALRLTENGAQNKQREGEVIVLSIGSKDVETTLRGALATGATRAIRVEPGADDADGRVTAEVLKAVALAEKPDVVLLGKQAVDGDSNQVGQILAELLDYPMATFAATIEEEPSGTLLVGREVDGGVIKLRLTLPCVITVDLRVVAPTSVYSKLTARTFKYQEGVRFAPLPAIMQAKKKPLDVKPLAELTTHKSVVHYDRFELPKARKAGAKVKDVAELVSKLKTEAKVI
jgi:electron transfer flavoprotein beta subunit